MTGSDDFVAEFMNTSGDAEILRSFRLVLALLEQDQALARTVRLELEADERGYEAALWALVWELAEGTAGLMQGGGATPAEAAGVLRDRMASIVFAQGMADSPPPPAPPRPVVLTYGGRQETYERARVEADVAAVVGDYLRLASDTSHTLEVVTRLRSETPLYRAHVLEQALHQLTAFALHEAAHLDINSVLTATGWLIKEARTIGLVPTTEGRAP